MQGRIIKALSGFYYVRVESGEVYASKPRGIFRKDDISPLVGDMVEMEITDTKDMEGSITAILPRKNALTRPPVANVDMGLVIFALSDPVPNMMLLDSFLVMMEHFDIDVCICINKIDLDRDDSLDKLLGVYTNIGYKCIGVSAANNIGIEKLSELLKGKLVTVAGPSGVGKSSIINALAGKTVMETGQISKKIKRGKQTTRHSELIDIGMDSLLADTPGFSSLFIPDMEERELAFLFPEFRKYLDECRFAGCSHIHERDCGIQNHLDEIDPMRYQNYCSMYEELKSRKRY